MKCVMNHVSLQVNSTDIVTISSIASLIVSLIANLVDTVLSGA